MDAGDSTQSTFVEMFNSELNKKNIQDVEVTKGNYTQVLRIESNKTKILQDQLKNVALENNELKKQIQECKLSIDQNKVEYTNLIIGLRNEMKSERLKLDSLTERNNELDDTSRKQKDALEKIRLNIDTEIRKRKNTERKLEAKDVERVTAAKQLELLKSKHKLLTEDIRSVNEKIEESINISNMLEEKYRNSVNFGRTLTGEYKNLEEQNEFIEKEKECLEKLVKCHEETNSKLAQLIIENIHPCDDRTLLSELCEMMSTIDKENNRHQHIMEQIKYESEMRDKSFQKFHLSSFVEEED